MCSGDVVPFPRRSGDATDKTRASTELLLQITTALGVPQDYFHTPSKTGEPSDEAEEQADHAAMAAAFSAIRDPLLRRHLVKIVQTLSAGFSSDA